MQYRQADNIGLTEWHDKNSHSFDLLHPNDLLDTLGLVKA